MFGQNTLDVYGEILYNRPMTTGRYGGGVFMIWDHPSATEKRSSSHLIRWLTLLFTKLFCSQMWGKA